MNIEKTLKDFLEDLEIESGRAQKTAENYERYLRAFIKITGISSHTDITDERVREFRLALKRKNLAPRTRNYHLIALRVFLKYLAKRDIASLPPERIELAKLSDRDIDIPDVNDLERLLSAPSGSSEQACRDKAILELLFSTGLRVSELANLTRDSIDFSRDEFSVRGKGGKIRLVFLSKGAKDALNAYLKKRSDILPSLFVSTKHKTKSSLTTRQIERLVRRYAIKAGIAGKVTPHTLRHLFATDLLINGADLRSVQSLLGHSSITTTQIYTHMTDRQLREVHKTFHGRRRK